MTRPRKIYVLACFACVYKRETNKSKGKCPKCGKPLKIVGWKSD